MQIRVLDQDCKPLGDWVDLTLVVGASESDPVTNGNYIVSLHDVMAHLQFNQAGLRQCFVEVKD